jgi:regulator of sirC expression with transglutaminase-like and TPR domain
LLAKQEEESFDSGALYEKLKVECAALELLNFLQYCSEEELQELIEKKQGG